MRIYFGSVKTTIDIPDKVLKEAIKHPGAKTKRDAVLTTVEEFNRRHQVEEMAQRLHGSPNFMTQKDLKVVPRGDKQKAMRLSRH